MFNPRAITLIAIIFAAAATRLVPPEFRPWNFTPVGAMCLFGGAYFVRKWQAFAAPLLALFASDLVLAATVYGFDSLRHVWMSYVLFAATVAIGLVLRGQVTFLRVGLAAIGASAMFFLVSNFYVWAAGHGESAYPHTVAGLLACYAAAIPFAQNMLLGNLFFSGVFFGGWELLQRGLPVLREPALAPARTQP
jgi:Family of unknown function (DUF6580)